MQELSLGKLHRRALELAQSCQVSCLRHQACSTDSSMQPSLLQPSPLQQQQQLLDGVSSSSQEEQLNDTLTAAVGLTDALAAGYSELLAAASGPRDLLIPPAQQKLQPSAAQRSVGNFQALCHYFAHCPAPSEVDWAEEIERLKRQQGMRAGTHQLALQQQQQHGGKEKEDPLAAVCTQEQQLWEAQAEACDMAAEGPMVAQSLQQSDVEALALQAPSLALADPQVYWRWQQTLLGLHECDVCGEYAAGQVGGWLCGACLHPYRQVHGLFLSCITSVQLIFLAAVGSVMPGSKATKLVGRSLTISWSCALSSCVVA